MSLNQSFRTSLESQIADLKEKKVYKRLNHLSSPQGAHVTMEGRGDVLILSSNNYLGLCNEPVVVEAGHEGLRKYGAGTGSVRFICGTFTVHRELEEALARFVGCEASMSFVSCWNANEGLTATIVENEDVVFSDELNHASIIDSMRLAKAITKCTTVVYRHSDLDDLVTKLQAHKGARRRVIWTDGVFSMEGSTAKLPQLLQIAKDHDAILAVDDSHSTGVLGLTGRGTAEHYGVLGEVDIITSTLGKALGGAAGGFVAGPAALADMLTQRSRPQLFSNALPPTVAMSALAAVRKVTTRLPPTMLYCLSSLAIVLYYVYKIPFLRSFQRYLPISRNRNWKWRWLDTFDLYHPKYQWFHTYPEVHRWFRGDFADIQLLDEPLSMRATK